MTDKRTLGIQPDGRKMTRNDNLHNNSIHRVSKKQSKLFSPQLRQIFTNFDIFWRKDSQYNRIV